MNQEIQLSVSPNLPAAPPSNSGGTGLMHLGVAQPPPTGLQLIHRLLRGRYGVALVLATLFAAAGASAGFLLLRQGFQSAGLIEIKPVQATLGNFDRVMPMYNYH